MHPVLRVLLLYCCRRFERQGGGGAQTCTANFAQGRAETKTQAARTNKICLSVSLS